MNDNEPKYSKPKGGGWNSAPDYTPQRGFKRSFLITLGLILLTIGLTAIAIKRFKAKPVITGAAEMTALYVLEASTHRLDI